VGRIGRGRGPDAARWPPVEQPCSKMMLIGKTANWLLRRSVQRCVKRWMSFRACVKSRDLLTVGLP